MKKILTALLTTALLASVNGCQTAHPGSEPAQQTLMVKAESATTTGQDATNITATLELIIAGINFKPTVSVLRKFVSKNESDSQITSPHVKQESSHASTSSVEDTDTQGTEPKTIDPTPAPKQPDTEPDATMAITVKATPTPLPTATPTPAPMSEPPAPTPIPEPVIEEPSSDIGYWIGYAQSCAQGLGLRLESSAVDCWDNPIGIGPHSTCLERDITSRLSRYANDPDITDVYLPAGIVTKSISGTPNLKKNTSPERIAYRGALFLCHSLPPVGPCAALCRDLHGWVVETLGQYRRRPCRASVGPVLASLRIIGFGAVWARSKSKQDKDLASQATACPPLLPAVRAVSGVWSWRLLKTEKAPMMSASPKSPVLQGFSRMSYSKKEELNE